MAHDVEKIGKLARISLSPHELKSVAKKFESVMAKFEELQGLDTEGVEPLYTLIEAMSLRKDQPQEFFTPDELLENACDRVDQYFRISKVVEVGDS